MVKLSPWVLVSLLVVVALWRIDLAATAGLFQSPPPSTPTHTATAEPATPSVTETPSPSETATPTEVPAATVAPTQPPQPTAPSTQIPPTATVVTPAPTQTVAAPTQVPPTFTPFPTATSTPEDERQRYSEGDSNLRFEWGMLVDSAALALAYTGLCCGVFLFLSIPVFFLVLWLAGKRGEQGGE